MVSAAAARRALMSAARSIRRSVAVGVVVGFVWGACAGMAFASFGRSTSASHSVSTATLASPTNLAVTNGTCVIGVSVALNLTWTATTSTWADGYHVLRSTTSGGPYTVVATLPGFATTAYVDAGLAFNTMYHYRVRAYDGATWRSVETAQVSKRTATSLCVV